MWITDYRERMGLELYQLQQIINVYNRQIPGHNRIYVSEQLLYILENIKNPVTHPYIANLIADVCEATREQRDSIVSEKYRGKWKPSDKSKKRVQKAVEIIRTNNYETYIAVNREVENEEPNPVYMDYDMTEYSQYPANRRGVVMINKDGEEVDRFNSLKDAEYMCGIGRNSIARRCLRQTMRDFDCSNPITHRRRFDYTFRYADEWDSMTKEEQKHDVCGRKTNETAVNQ